MDAPRLTHAAREAASELEDAAVGWLLLWSPRVDDNELELDLLVAPDDADRLEGAVARAGFRRVRHTGYPSHRYFVADGRSADEPATALDVVTDLRFGRNRAFRLGGAAEVLARREARDGWPRPAATDSFWILLFHALLDKPGFPGRHAHDLQALARSAASDASLAAYVRRTFPQGWDAAKIRTTTTAGDWNALRSLARPLRLRMAARAPFGTAARALHYGIARRAWG